MACVNSLNIYAVNKPVSISSGVPPQMCILTNYTYTLRALVLLGDP